MPYKKLTLSLTIPFLFIIINMGLQTPLGRLLTDLIGSVPYADKSLHFFTMACFAFLLNGACRQKTINFLSHSWMQGSLLAASFITLEECSQLFIPSRNFEIIDLLCNYAGIFIGSFLSRSGFFLKMRTAFAR